VNVMQAVKITRTIRSQTLRIKELEALRGQTVEIIILAEDDAERHEIRAPSPPARTSAAGMLSKYRNPKLIEQESLAWELAVKEKYANR
jgi:hypothetical protein